VLVVSLHELLVAHQLDLLLSLLDHVGHILKAEFPGLLALTTRIAFLVEFGAFALEAFHVFSEAIFFGSTLLARVAFLVDLSSFALEAFTFDSYF
jgi:hypothetical protein